MAALPLTSYISQTSNRERNYRLISSQFGDGYSQRAPSGLNAQQDKWTLQYDNLSATDRDTLWTFLNTHGSWTSFTWAAPGDGGTTKKWVVGGPVQERAQAGNLYSISVPIEQCFDL